MQNKMAMKEFASLFSVFFIFLWSALAQEPNRSRGQGYFFFAPGLGNRRPGGNELDIHIGAGGEGFIDKGLGVGVELGPVGPTKHGSSTLGWFDDAVGLGSANLSYHFLPSTIDRKFEPFVTAGYSLFFRAGTSSGVNAGWGGNVWMNKNAALRFEGRVHATDLYHFASFRVGMTFR